MLIQLFAGRKKTEDHVFLPQTYQKTVRWLPQIGDIFPNFQASTTEGPLRFNAWAEGHWSFLFSHPAAFTPVCTTEMVSLAAAHADFEARNVKLLGFTASPLQDQRNWHHDISDQFGFHVQFPTVDDHDGELARAFGMIHERESSTWPIRKSLILDPNMRVRMIFEYPIFVGRSTSEVIRAIDALQMVDKHDVATPADWQPGEDYLCSEKHDAAHDLATYGDRLRRLTPYLALIRPE
jgi:thioredoxin-dependent peroxiredoxin